MVGVISEAVMAAVIVAAVEARKRKEKEWGVSLHGSKAMPREIRGARESTRVEASVGGAKWKIGEEAMRKNLDSAVADSTRKVYKYWWKRFEVFCLEAKVAPLQASVYTVMTFLSFLAENSRGQGGVKGAKAALHHCFLMGGRISVPTEDPRVLKLIRGVERRFAVPVKKSAVLTKQDFRKFLDVVTEGGKIMEIKLGRLRLAAQVKVHLFCGNG